jgi:hypothetical protein
MEDEDEIIMSCKFALNIYLPSGKPMKILT